MFLQRISDTRTPQSDCTTSWSQLTQSCQLDDNWKAVALMGMTAVEDFNARNGRFVPAFASDSTVACDKTISPVVYDSGSNGAASVSALITALTSSSSRPNVIVGPSRSAAALPTATVAGVEDIPQISYWATSKSLDKLNEYPRFMRTIPSDDSVALGICQFWASEMGYSVAAIIHANDAYGQAYQESLSEHCLNHNLLVSAFPYDPEDEANIVSQVRSLAATDIRVVIWVGSEQGLHVVLEEAWRQDLLGGDKGAMWLFSDGATVEMVGVVGADELAAGAPVDAHSGALRVLAVGGVESNPRWASLLSVFPSLSPNYTNSLLPSDWQIGAEMLPSYEAASSGYLSDIGAYEYDAVAAVGLLACAVAPTGPLPADFGARFWAAKQNASFLGLTGTVSFDALGNRAAATVTHELSNVIVDASDGGVSEVLRAQYNQGQWVWEGGGRDASGIRYLGTAGSSSTPPPDLYMPPVELVQNFLPDGLKYTAWGVICALYAVIVAFGVWTRVHWRNEIVKASQPEFLMLILLGGAVSLAAAFPLAMDHNGLEPANTTSSSSSGGGGGGGGNATADGGRGLYPTLDIACNAQVWLYCIGFALTFGSLFAKLWRIKRVLINPSLSQVKISKASMFARIGALLFIEGLLLSVWMGVSPLYYRVEVDETDRFGRVVESHGHCVGDDTAVAFLFTVIGCNLLLLGWGFVQVMQARSVPTKYNEGKYLAICITNNLQTTFIAVLLAFFIHDSPVPFFIIKWTAILSCDAGTLFLIFGPKVLLLHRGKRVAGTRHRDMMMSMGGTVMTEGGTPVPVTTDFDAEADKYAGQRPKGANDFDELEELRQENEELRDLLRRMRDPSVRMSSCRASKRDSKASRCSKGAAGSELERDSKSEGGVTPSSRRFPFGNHRKLSAVGENTGDGASQIK